MTEVLHIQIMVSETILKITKHEGQFRVRKLLDNFYGVNHWQPTQQAHACCRLEGIDYVRTFDDLRKKYEQNNESVPTTFVT